MLIFISLVFVLIFTTIAILSLNYAIYTWENKKVSNLANQIKPAKTNLSSGGSFAKNFSSLDLGSSMNKSKAIQAASNIYGRAMVSITNQDYPGWLNKFLEELKLFRKNAWKSTVRLFNYLLNLTKPVHAPEVEVQPTEKSGEKIVQTNKIQESDSQDQESVKVDKEAAKDSEEKVKDISYKPPKSKQTDDLATISIAGKKSNTGDNLSVFEKLENRIIYKLKSSGFEQYDIWLELGSLYEKYGEKDKASQVYAVVMKHSEGKEKDLARDKLIGLS
ncbi:MAG: hypothetical protein AAGF07_03155 [Patescibacteria group bacterium]